MAANTIAQLKKKRIQKYTLNCWITCAMFS